MYVCVCHALRCRDVKQVAQQGGCRVSDVHRHYGVKVQCGRCVPCIRDMLSDATKATVGNDSGGCGSAAVACGSAA